MSKVSDRKLGLLMLGLIYPAVLGAAIVWNLGYMGVYISQLSSFNDFFYLFKDLKFLFSLWLLIYFCVPYLIMLIEDYPKGYGKYVFMTDIGDVIVIFVVIFSLGLITPSDKSINYLSLYLAILAIPILAGLSNYLSGRDIRFKLSASMIFGAVIMVAGLYKYPIANYIAVFLLYILLIVYFIQIHRSNKLDKKRENNKPDEIKHDS